MTVLNRTFFFVNEFVRFYFSYLTRVGGHVSIHSAGKQDYGVPEHFSVSGFGGRVFEVFELLSRSYMHLVVKCVNFFADSHFSGSPSVGFGISTVVGWPSISPPHTG